jgi:predicted nucleic acid-binding protein
VALLSSSYILVETFALVQRRLGMEAVRTVDREMVPLLSLHWLDADLHHRAVAAWLEANRRSLSLVDCTSFEVMRRRDVQQAFAFDGHFEEHGFEVLQT